MTRSAGLASALVAGALSLQGPALAQTLAAPPSIVVAGQASVEVVPDRAVLTIGVVAEASTAAAASSEAGARAGAVLAQIKAEGIEARDIATGSVSLYPIFREAGSGKATPPRAYRASTSLTVSVTPPDRAGPIAARLVDKGANTLEGIAFTVSAQPQRLDALRAEAVRDARHKAEIFAAALDLKLGPVVEVMPDADGGPGPVFARAPMPIAKAAGAPMPVEPGSLTLRTGVTVRWQLTP